MDRELDRKFLESGQEAQKLGIALQRYFEDDLDGQWKERYEIYLKQRIRPAVSQLIRLGEIEKTKSLVEKDWLGSFALEECIRMSGQEGQLEIQIFLLEWKQKKYGFSDREYTL